jgi:hypothetical protein
MNSQELSKILQIVKTDEAARNHLFCKLETAKNPMPLLKPLKDAGYFGGEKNPEPIEDSQNKGWYSIPYWRVLGFLENVSKQNGEKPDKEITILLLEIIESITSYKNPTTGQRVNNYHTDRFILKIISNLPSEYISERHVRLADTFLRTKFGEMSTSLEVGQTLLAKLVEHKGKKLLLMLLEIILDFDINLESHRERFNPLMNKYWLRKALGKYKVEIAKICAPEAIDVAMRGIEKILKVDENEFSYNDIPSIEDHAQNWMGDSYEFQLVFLIRDMLWFGEPIKVRPIIEELLKKENPIFQRLGLFGVNKHYQNMKELFWTWESNPLVKIDCTRELYRLIEENCEDFSEIEISRYLHWVETMAYEGETDEQSIAYRRKMWLLPFKKKDKCCEHKLFNELYEKYNRISPGETDHPGWLSWQYESWGHEEAFEEKEFITKTNKEQIEFLNNYRFEQGWKKPGPGDIAYKLQQVVAEQPQRFTEDLISFRELERDGDKLALLRGIRGAWEKGRDFGWENIFTFCEGILEEHGFWEKEYGEREYNYKRAFIQEICDLMITGMRKDSHAFDKSLLPRAEVILLELGKRTRTIAGEFPENEKLTITNVINSVRYDVFSAIMNYALRYARIYAKEQKARWQEKIRDYFEVGLDKAKEPSLYYSTSMGRYLANLMYLDRDWVWGNIDRIFPKENESHWRATFRGYLSMEKVYKEIYLLLKEHGHYKKAIETNLEDEYGNKYVAQHICIGYLGGDEILSDSESLISKLLEKDDAEVIGDIIDFIDMSNKSNEKKHREKIKPLWKKMYELLQAKKDAPEYANIIRRLCSWLDEIDTIDDETIEWVKFSIDHIKEYWDSYDITKYLSLHVRKTPGAVGDLYVYMLGRGYYPDFAREDIQRIVEVLYEKQLKERADEICRLYQARGHEFLKEIYMKNNHREST